MLGYNALSTGTYRRFGGVYCLPLQIGLQLQYLPVFTALYPIRLESLTGHFLSIGVSEFQTINKNVMQ
jgi:hypothetical protein